MLALIVALALQVGVNYANDYSDGVRGTDEQRVGPVRLVAAGVAPPRQVRAAALACFAIACVAGFVLAAVTSWWLILLGAAAVAAAWTYTGGSHPYGYHGLGEIAVFAFFGVAAVAGTAYVQMGRLSWLALAACAPGRAARLRPAGDQQPAGHPVRHPRGQAHARGHPRRPAHPLLYVGLRAAAVRDRGRHGSRAPADPAGPGRAAAGAGPGPVGAARARPGRR